MATRAEQRGAQHVGVVHRLVVARDVAQAHAVVLGPTLQPGHDEGAGLARGVEVVLVARRFPGVDEGLPDQRHPDDGGRALGR
jgi:hypothetical protein